MSVSQEERALAEVRDSGCIRPVLDFTRDLRAENEKIAGSSAYEDYYVVRLVREAVSLPEVDFCQVSEIVNGQLGNKTLIIELFPDTFYYYSLVLGVSRLKRHLLESYANFRTRAQKEI